ncbi:MAG: lipocalin [Planctomycetes bacterium]|nr:lipocalin [Planctomycetota bacterium]
MRLLTTCAGLALAALAGCASPPRGVEPVSGFQADRYLGTWYEIARLDHRFERGLSNVTAEYTLLEDGRLRVINRGYDERRGRWREIGGVARFMGPRDVASLKVTFFWPFRGAYHVIALDREGYDYAMVTSSSRDYLWILARRPHLDPAVLEGLLAKACQWGFRTDDLIFVEHGGAGG